MENDRDKPPVDAETLLFTLDQLSQTVEVMSKVIGRLRGYIHQNMTAERQGQLAFDRDGSGSDEAVAGSTAAPATKGPRGLH